MSELSTLGAFVVQFRRESDVGRGHLVGRVEHVESGEVAHFRSLEELLNFVGRVLRAVGDVPPGKS